MKLLPTAQIHSASQTERMSIKCSYASSNHIKLRKEKQALQKVYTIFFLVFFEHLPLAMAYLDGTLFTQMYYMNANVIIPECRAGVW